jgi:hypothetical protein
VQAVLLTMFTTTWNINMTEELDTDYGSLTVGEANLRPYNITMSNNAGQVGELDFNGPELKFRGKADESAQVFMDWLAECFKGRLQEERRQERERCIQMLKELPND